MTVGGGGSRATLSKSVLVLEPTTVGQSSPVAGDRKGTVCTVKVDVFLLNSHVFLKIRHLGDLGLSHFHVCLAVHSLC